MISSTAALSFQGSTCFLNASKKAFSICSRRKQGKIQPGAVKIRAEGDSYKMYVPPDAFGGESPERKAARGIRAMHTYVAAHVVAAQLMNVAPRINTLDGTDGGSGQDGAHESSRIAQGYDLIMSFLAENPVKDGDEWLRKLAGQAPSIASRIATVRLAYCSQDFEWNTLKKLCIEETEAANAEVMRSWVKAVFGPEGEEDGKPAPGGGGGTAGGGGSGAAGQEPKKH